MNSFKVVETLTSIRENYNSGVSRSYKCRIEQLKKLKTAIKKNEQAIFQALYTDLHKSAEESWVTEIGLVIAEINTAISNLKEWMRPEHVETNLVNLPSKSYIIKEPLGVVLIIGPWNYPFQLLFNPLVGAIAAGNCCVLKPSEHAPATDAVMRSLIENTFDPNYITYIQGDGSAVIPEMMNNFTFDHIFYTGSTAVGKIIYKMAAEKLVPVTLELGGKSPCVVEADANITVAARRIAMTKFSNAGQMCVAPDYVMVHESIKDKFISKMKQVIKELFGSSPEKHENFGRIINERQFDRLTGYLNQGNIIHGGSYDRANLYIEPTVIDDVQSNAPIMKDEIFGPILPIISFRNTKDATAVINKNPNPLAFYIYTSSKRKEREWLQAVPAGGSCINNSSWHLTNHNLPFGGRGFSGTGCYHGKYSFDTFSHKRAVMKTPSWFDPSIKYPPFKGKLRLFKWIIR